MSFLFTAFLSAIIATVILMLTETPSQPATTEDGRPLHKQSNLQKFLTVWAVTTLIIYLGNMWTSDVPSNTLAGGSLSTVKLPVSAIDMDMDFGEPPF